MVHKKLWYILPAMMLVSQSILANMAGGGKATGTCADGTDVEVLFGYGDKMVPTKTPAQISDELEKKCKEKGSTLSSQSLPQ